MTDWQRRRYEDAKKAYAALMEYYPLTLDGLDGERWLEIDENYHASNFGRIKSFYGRKPRILKPVLTGQGYLFVNLHVNGEVQQRRIHRIVAELFIPNPYGKPEVNHADGHKFNCHVSNLEWATSAENRQHAYKTKLLPSGGDRSDADLTNEQVKWIRSVYKARDPQFNAKALASVLDVSADVVRWAIRGKTYKNVGGKIHGKYGVPPEIRDEIRRTYKKGVRGLGSPALAKKYGCSQSTILYIVNEK